MLATRVSIIVNRLIGPVFWVGEHGGSVASHLAVVAVFAGVGKKDAASIVSGGSVACLIHMSMCLNAIAWVCVSFILLLNQ